MNVSSGLKPGSSPIKLDFFYSQVSKDEIQIIKDALTHVYKDFLEVFVEDEVELLNEAYDTSRGQYNAEVLLRHLIRNRRRDVGLWVISEDIYASGMNFVFGLAQPFKGAVLSVYRLSTRELIRKEAVHEVGHVFGLSHCSNSCVMQYSNSLWEAKIKPSFLCENCKRKLSNMLRFY